MNKFINTYVQSTIKLFNKFVLIKIRRPVEKKSTDTIKSLYLKDKIKFCTNFTFNYFNFNLLITFYLCPTNAKFFISSV